jgi:uncharacterized protein YggE
MRAAALVLAGCLALPAVAASAETTPPRTISTSGVAIVHVVPDEVVVGFGVETFKEDLDAAKKANDEACARLLKSIRSSGVEAKHIRTDTLGVQIKYKNSSHPSHGIEGYFARRAYSVTLKDTARLESVVGAALKNGANRITGFDFRTTSLRKHRDEARRRAVLAAKEKAEALTAALGAKIGAPRSIHEGSPGHGGYRSWWGWGNVNWQANAQVMMQAGGPAEDGGTTPLGMIPVRAQVSVTFDLEP